MGTTGDTEHAGAGHLRRLLGHALTVLWVAGAVLAGSWLWPSSLGGCTTLTIVSGHSMEPTYYTGDLVVARCGPVQVGDVVVYSPPDIAGARVIHRVVGGSAADGWVIQGDNNDFLDPWTPTAEDVHGSAVLHLPQIGTVASILLSPLTWISLLVVALAVVVWPGRPDDRADDEADDDDAGAGDSSSGGASEVPALPAPSLLDRLGAATRGALGSARGRRAALGSVLALSVAIPLGTGAGVAHAAAVRVTAASLGAHQLGGRCTTDVVTGTSSAPSGTGTATAVAVTVPAPCVGTRGKLSLIGVTGVVDVLFDVTATTTSVPVPAGYQAAAVTGFALTLGTWGMHTTWLPATNPASSVYPASGWTSLQQTWYRTGSAWCVSIRVGTTDPGAKKDRRAWSIAVDTRAYPWNGATTGYTTSPGWPVLRGPDATGILYIDGGTSDHAKNAPGADAATFDLCRS